MDLGLRGRAAFVAASSKGMGRAIAEQFAIEGADVGMCSRSASALQAAADEIRAHGGRVVATAADLADAEQTRIAVERAVAELGRLDVLVVNAGGPSHGVFADLDDERFQAANQLTFMSAVHLIQAALPALRRSDAAAILFIASTSVKQPISGLTSATASEVPSTGSPRRCPTSWHRTSASTPSCRESSVPIARSRSPGRRG